MKKVMVGLILFMLLVNNFSVFYENTFNRTAFDQQTDEETKQQNNQNMPREEDTQNYEQLISDEIDTTNTISYDTWYLGESVAVDYSFPKQAPDFSGIYYSFDSGQDAEQTTGHGYIDSPGYVINDDELTTGIHGFFDKDYTGYVYFKAFLPVTAIAGGVLHYEVKSYCSDGSYTKISNEITGTYAVSSSDIFADGKVIVELNCYAEPNDNVEVSIRIHTPNGRIIIKTSTSVQNTFSYINQAGFYVDVLYYQRDTINVNIRSHYQYASETNVVHKLEIDNFDYHSTIKVYKPDIWVYASISPSATVTEISGNIEISNTIPTTYELLFISNCSYFLAIQDVSSDYLQDVGFEGGTWQDDWQYPTIDTWETIEISSNVVSEGYYSLHLKRTADYDAIAIYPETLPNGYYYFSWDIYFVENSGDPKMIFMNSGATDWAIFDMTGYETNRWYKCFFYTQIHASDSQVGVIRFRIYTGTVECYLDNFRIFKTSTTIQTLAPSKYQITSTLHVWDGYQNPTLPNHEIIFTLFDRTQEQTDEDVKTVATYDTTADAYGIAMWFLELGLEQKEYELWTYAPDSTWGQFTKDTEIIDYPTEDDGWADWGWYTSTGSNSFDTSDYTTGSGSLKLELQSDVNSWWHWGKSDSVYYELEHNWVLIFDIKANLTTKTFIDVIDSDGSANGYYRYEPGGDIPIYTTWTTYYIERARFKQANGEPLDDVNQINFRYFANEWITFWIDNFHFVFAQTLYFTPSSPSHTDYAKTELEDEWDWTEGDAESVGIGIFDTSTDVVENGYIEWVKTTNRYYTYVYFSYDDIDYTYYNYLVARVYSNSTYSVRPRWRDSDGSFHTPWIAKTTQPNEWLTIVVDLSSLEDWASPAHYDTYFGVYFEHSEHDYATDLFRIDFIRLVHVETPSLVETDTNFYLTSANNTYKYAIYSDSQYIGTVNDLETILKNNTVGSHNLTYVLYSASETKAYLPQTYQYSYTVDPSPFTVSVQSFYLSDLYVNLYVTSNYDGTYTITSGGTGSGTLHKEGTTITVARDTTPGATIHFVVQFTYNSETVTFETYYTNPSTDFYVTDYRISETSTQVTLTWDTSKASSDQVVIYHDDVLEGTYTTSPVDIDKSSEAGTHHLTFVFQETSGNYEDVIYTYSYTVLESTPFSVTVSSFYLSDSYVNTYVTATKDGSYYIYEDNSLIGSGTFYATGTAIASTRTTTPGVTINYAIKFVNDTDIVWFNTTYSNPEENFYVNYYSVEIGETSITITWDTTKDSIDSLTVYEDGVLQVNSDIDSPTSWSKSEEVGTHYVTLVFQATNFQDVVYAFTYIVEPETFEVNVESFYLSEDYVNTYITATQNGYYIVYENDTAITDQTTFYYAGTSIQTPRDTTSGATIFYAIKFWDSTETTIIWFNTTYSNMESEFYVTDYSINIGTDTITVTWTTSLPDSDYVTVKEDGVTIIASDVDSPTTWTKSSVVGLHYVTLIFQADGYTPITYTFNYRIYEVADFKVNVESFYLSDQYVHVYITANYDGTYTIYENNVQQSVATSFDKDGTTITSPRNTEAGTTIAFAIKFVYNTEIIWFNTTYSNPATPEPEPNYVTTLNYYVDVEAELIYVNVLTYWNNQTVRVADNGTWLGLATKEGNSIWSFIANYGFHNITIHLFNDVTETYVFSFGFTIQTPTAEAFRVTVSSFYLSDLYVNTYITSNYNGTYTIYENNTQIASGSFLATGTAIVTTRSQQVGTILYAIKFTYSSETVWFNSSYSNAAPTPQPNYVTILDYSVDIEAETIYVNLQTFWANQTIRVADNGTWLDTYKDEGSSYWSFTASYGFHNITIHVYNGLEEKWVFSFGFTIRVPTVEAFKVNVESFYVSNDYVNLYVTANYNYTYTIYTNDTIIGTGNGLAVGTTIIATKEQEAGLYNFTVVFSYGTETVIFTTWYSVLKPPATPQNTVYREQTQGNYTIIIDTNADNFWIKLYHDNEEVGIYQNQKVLVVEKKLEVGWHNVSFDFIYNVSTDEEGYPCDPYNITLSYGPFWYETILFYDVAIRYMPTQTGLAVSDFDVDSVLTYLDGELVQAAQNLTMPQYANYSYIFNNRIWIHNTMPVHTLKVCDLLGRTIIEQQIDLSTFKYALIELPIEQLTIVNLDTEAKKVKINPLGDEDYVITPEIAPGQILSYWLKNGTYEYTLYILQAYYDSTGVLQHIWIEKEKKTIKIPFTLVIPLSSTETEIISTTSSFWDKYGFWVIIGAVAVGLIGVSILLNRFKQWNMRMYLEAQRVGKRKEVALRSLLISPEELRALKTAQKINGGKRK